MNRREFLKAGLATLASAWCVGTSKDCVIAEIDDTAVYTENVIYDGRDFEVFPISCKECFSYFCDDRCPHYVQPYFVTNRITESDYPVWAE